MAKVVIVGAGPMGLAAGYYAVRAGHEVEIVEADDRVGGMAAHFDFDGLSLERFYHFCCLSDVDTIGLLAELGLDPIAWRETKMGYFIGNKLLPFGDPISLLTFPALGPIEKLRYGLMAFISTKRSDWQRLDKISAKDWFIGWCGQSVYDRLWKPLFELKFFEYSDRISAAWIWQRIKRIGNSRKSLFQEQLGYIPGGTETLMNALAEAIMAAGGKIRLKDSVKRIRIVDGAVTGVETASGVGIPADFVISTAPLPYIPGLVEQDAPALAETYKGFDNVGCVCVVHKLKKSVTPNFWLNISDPAIDIPGIVEFSNLRPTGDTIVYVPYYMPTTHEKFGWTDEALADESFRYIQKVNPALTADDRLAVHVGRLRYAQPVCEVGFAARIPAAQTPVRGLQIADTCFYYPEDRGVSESIGFARRMVEALPGGAR